LEMKIGILVVVLLTPALALANPGDKSTAAESATVAAVVSAFDQAISVIPENRRQQLPARIGATLWLLWPGEKGSSSQPGLMVPADNLLARDGDAGAAIQSTGQLMSFTGRVFRLVGGEVPLPPDVSARVWAKVAKLAEARAADNDEAGRVVRALIWNGVADVADGAAAASRLAAETGRTMIEIIGDGTKWAGDAAEVAGRYFRF